MIIKIPVYVLLEKVGDPIPIDHELLKDFAVQHVEEYLSEKDKLFRTTESEESKKFNKDNFYQGSSLTREEALEFLRTRN